MSEFGMDMNRFENEVQRVNENSGAQFSDITKLIVTNNQPIRIIGSFESNWEHFVQTDKGNRPYYCSGPDSDCPICSAISKLVMSNDEMKQKIGKGAKAKEKFYFNVLDRTPQGKQGHSISKKSFLLSQNPKAMNIGSQLFQAIGAIVAMRKQQGQDPDPNNYDIVLQKTGTGMNTKYSAQFSGDCTPLTEEEKSYELWPLKSIAAITSMNELLAVSNFLLGDQNKSISPMQNQHLNMPGVQPNIPNPQPMSPPTNAWVQPQMSQPQVPQMQPQQPQQQIPQQQPQQQMRQTQPQSMPANPIVNQNIEPWNEQQNVVSQYQDSTPGRDVDMSVFLEVPCSSCGAKMLISMEDTRDFACHSCGQVFTHPSKN